MGERASTDAIVVGGGIAGVSAMYALSKRGIRSILLESSTVASGASGNPLGLLSPLPEAVPTVLGRWYESSFEFTHNLILELNDELKFGFRPIGVAQIPLKPAQRKLAQLLTVAEGTSRQSNKHFESIERDRTKDVTGVSLDTEILFCSGGGVIEPARFCHGLCKASEPFGDLVLDSHVVRIEKSDGGWDVVDKNSRIWHAPVVVIANSSAAREFDLTSSLPLEDVEGEMATFPASLLPIQLKSAIAFDGYLLPGPSEQISIGSTFCHKGQPEPAKDILLTRAAKFIPLIGTLTSSALTRRRSIRCSTRDRFPYVGPLVDAPGIYLSVGYGSRGLSAAPLAGEIIAAAIAGETAPIPGDLYCAVSASRSRLI